ncbi:Cytoplasmic dynein 2 heavy chain 1 [Boothiomyces sp. JEL0838]|nr:Cytoplasmic dynein 2 heavy chain 1 [Boothiomyces sp. JEL0838]
MEAKPLIKKLVQVQLSQYNADLENNAIKIENTFHQDLVCMMLTKLKPVSINKDNFDLLRFVPISSNPINELYQSIHSIFTPMLQKGKINTKIQGILSDLEANLKQTLKQDLIKIDTINDEYLYWESEYLSNSGEAKIRAEFFKDLVNKLQFYDRISTMNDLTDAVDELYEITDEIWRQHEHSPFPQQRLGNLFEIISNQIHSFILNHPIHELQDYVLAKQLIESLFGIFDTLTSKIWPNTLANRWEGEPFTSVHLSMLLTRINQIIDLISTNELLMQLNLDYKNSFDKNENLLILSNQKFNEIVHLYDTTTLQVKEKAISNLQKILSNLQNQPNQLKKEFQKYKALIEKPSVSVRLESEKQNFLAHSINWLKKISLNFADKKTEYNLTPVIGNIIWARQTINRINETESILSFMENNQFTTLSNSLLSELKHYEQEQFDSWKASLGGDHSFGQLMELDLQSGKLVVNYKDYLVSLVRETRQLQAMGFKIPTEILKLNENAKRFYRYSLILKQISNFYNTIDQQMLPSQQSMMLLHALEFEKIVKKSIDWTNIQEIDNFVSKIQQQSNLLTTENTKLKKFHSIIMDHVKTLLGTDLVKNQHVWKEILNSIRQILNTVQEKTKPELTLSWRNHIDYQLYKALEAQYQVGLETLHERLPEIKVDLIYKSQKLQFRPSFEEIKAKYYREMKKFINLPTSFKPLGESKIFKFMVQRNSGCLISVYKKADALFNNLIKVIDVFKDWVILGSIDLDEFLKENITEISEYETNFRLLKQKGKDSELLPTSIQVDCISISTVPVKSTIDDHLQKLFDGLLNTLKSSIVEHLKIVEQFSTVAMDILLQRPQTMQEIGTANQVHQELSKNKLAIQTHFEQIEAKNKVLKTVAGTGVDYSIQKTKWSKLELMLESHELMIKEQVDLLRGKIDSRIASYLSDLEKFSARWNQLKPKAESEPKASLNFIVEKQTEFKELLNSKEEIHQDCIYFGIEQPEFSELAVLQSSIESSYELWTLVNQFNDSLSEYKQHDWISFRGKTHLFDEFLNEWSEKLHQKNEIVFVLKQVNNLKTICPLLKYLRGDNWMSEHWGELFRLISIKTNLADLLFGHLLDVGDNVQKNLNQIIELNSRANGEISIREALQELDIWGASSVFSLLPHMENVSLIKEWKETLTQIGDNQSLLSSLKDSPYFKNFSDKIIIWEQKLAECDEYLHKLNNIQRKWVYLEPIFSKGALPSEQARFSRIDEDFRSIMQSIKSDPRIVSITTFPNIKSILNTLQDQLDRCQKALNEFLEEKRSKFARFYFLGDDDLLEILGQAQNPQIIQTHLKKLFAGVHSVEFDADSRHIVAMKSLHGEVVPLKTPVLITDQVEMYLQDFAMEMARTLEILLDECLREGNIFKYPTQIVGLAEYLQFTANVERVLQSGGDFSPLLKSLTIQLEKYTTYDSKAIEDKTEKTITELKIKSLILDIIHFIDVVGQLKNVTSVEAWSWRKQLRFYLNKDKKCVIRMHDAEFRYSYEYQGIPPKLVHTPLTDKCYLTLTQAMASGFGGNPFGPAGTGKTESVKALGVLFGRQVLVFNCDEGIDYKSMARIFVGLVKCGAWGCFDEFNRLEEAVLSAVSQQIQVIQNALKKQEKNVVLLGKSIDLDPNSGIFVTLNPAGKGYGGRQRLPDNLKQLFRSVAMTHPNYDLIAEVILLSEGFKSGKLLGSKVVSIFSLSKQFLTVQQHYDWGLRPLKAVLSLAGNLIHEEKKKNKEINESMVIVKALCASIISKLTFSDTQRFNLLLKDLFPDIQMEDIIYEQLDTALREAYKELDLIYLESQAEKVFQLYEACRQRMGVVLVGPSGSGKTTIWKLLEKAWSKMGQKLIVHKSNPKAIDRQMLLGHMDIDTREWSDGVLTFASRQAVKENLDTHSWIICDGDIDPEWVESLNSVLDDNRLLTMPNGERIQFGPNVNFMFETHNLTFASPATVSRMGMIYLSDETLDSKILTESWLNKRPENVQSMLKTWIDQYLFQSIEWLRKNCEFVVETTKAGLIMNGLSHVQNAKDNLSFLYGLVRGLGSNLLLEQRQKFAQELFNWGNETVPDPKKILDYYVNQKGNLELYQREDPEGLHINQMNDLDSLPVVETVDIKRAIDIIMPWLKDGSPFLIVGPEGAGKYTTLRHCFSKLKSTNVAIIHCSSQTKSVQVLQRLYQSCVAATTTNGRVLRPKDAEKLILYLKDINLPSPDKYDTVELVQFLQQLLTYKGFFDSSLEWISIENIQIVASMNPSSAVGRNKLSTRFTSTVRLCYISYTDRDQLQSIYKIFLEPIIEHCSPNHRVWSIPKNISKLASTIVNIYEQTVQKFTVDMYSHYTFTPRDISRILLSLVRYVYSGNDEKEIIDILAYEAQRLFQDRLVGTEARQKFQSSLYSILRTDWNYEGSLSGYVYSKSVKTASTMNLSLGTAMVKKSLDECREQLQSELHAYERDVQDLDLQLFPEMLEQITRIERILGQAGGSVLLAGRPGIAYNKLVTFVSYSYNYKLVYPKVSPTYTLKLFLADIKQALQIAGVQAEDVTFMIEDFQLVHPSFLEIINSLLSGSEVGGIYTQEELDAISNQLKDSFSQESFRGTMYEYFVSRIRKYLHIALIFDSASSDFVNKCEANPALYTRCQMLWTEYWSGETMNIMIKNTFDKSSVLKDIPEKEIIGRELLAIHQSCVENGATSKHFVEYLAMYDQVYKSKKDTMQKKQNYLHGGLKKLQEAAAFVDKLSKDAKQQQKELAIKQSEADQALKQITESMIEASEQKKEMESLSETLREEESKMLVRKQAVEKELSEVEPVIRAAKAAVGEIRSESLSEIRSLRAPPPAIRDVLEAVLRLMGILDMSWNSMKGFLGQRTVKDEIMNFDVRSITKQTRDAVSQLIAKNQASFEEATIKRASVAAAPLAMWVKANIQYAAVVEKVAPLENDLKRLTNTLEESRARVAKLKEGLDLVDRKVEALREDFGSKTREAESLRAGLERAMEIMTRAQGLLEKLSGEGKRWNIQFQELETHLKQLPRNAMLSAAFIVYLAGASEDQRQSAIEKWSMITTLSEPFDFRSVMSSESEQLIWKTEGLPADNLSIENAIIILSCKTTPLLIDPSGQSIEWLKAHLKEKKPEVVNQSDDNFLRSLELAVRFGKTLIVQEVSKIEPVLVPLIRKNLLKQGPRFMVEIGEKSIDYNEEFKLILVTRRSTFTLATSVRGFVNDINFTITRAGLAGKLLGLTLKHERPELELQKVELLRKEEELKIHLTELEDTLLKELANAEGNILENQGLIKSLNEAKEKSTIIGSSLTESRALQRDLDLEREKYAAISVHGSSLYFVINELFKLNNMYQFSLATFLRIFNQSLSMEKADNNVEMRNKLLQVSLEKLVFNYVSRSIFKADRHMFALFLLHELHPTMFEQNEWELFTGQILTTESTDNADTPEWVPQDRKGHFLKLLNTLPALAGAMNFNSKDIWMKWMKDASCETSIPKDRISPFQKLLVIQALRPDRLLTAMTIFCTAALNQDSLSPSSLNLKLLLENETIASEPILFIITPGADPSQDIRDFAISEIGADKLHEVSMGQGQGDTAIQLIRSAMHDGEWVYLQNIHLVIGWVSQLEKELASAKPHPKFRLWLTSESHPKFPASLSESCLKITVEAPPGLKKNLKRIYDNWSPEFIANGSYIRSQALFALAWFHAVIQERRNYIPQGWNKFYEFSAADLRSCADILHTMFSSGETIQWEIVHGLVKSAIYGGRIDDEQDALKLETYLAQIFNNELFPPDGKSGAQKFCKLFVLPKSTDHTSYKQIINELPELDNVLTLGLPANIDRTLQNNTSQEIISKLQLLKRHAVHAQRFNKEKWTLQILPLLQLWKKLNTGTDLLQKKVTPQSNVDPIIAFFDLELTNALKLVQMIHAHFGDISKILRGTALLSNEVQQIGTALVNGETPKLWLDVWEGPETVHLFIENVVIKCTAVGAYRDKALSGTFFSSPIQLGQLFNPQPMDTLKLVSTWRGEQGNSLYNITVENLLIQGCTFDGTNLLEAGPNDPIFATVPSFQLAWVPEESVKMAGKMNIPVYVTPNREKAVTNLCVPYLESPSQWILAGVAFFLSTE